MRILVTVSPLMYREAIVWVLQTRRPDYDVLLGSGQSLNGPTATFDPHMVIKDDIETMLGGSVICTVEIHYRNSMSASITLGDDRWLDEDLSTRTLLRITDLTRSMIS